jgi:hypothetical protein
MNPLKRTIYTTKYCLTRGVVEAYNDCQPQTDGDETSKYWYYKPGELHMQFIIERNGFFTYEEAAARATKDRERKIKALEKQIDRLRKMEF